MPSNKASTHRTRKGVAARKGTLLKETNYDRTVSLVTLEIEKLLDGRYTEVDVVNKGGELLAKLTGRDIHALVSTAHPIPLLDEDGGFKCMSPFYVADVPGL